jgi:hypothetical protein
MHCEWRILFYNQGDNIMAQLPSICFFGCGYIAKRHAKLLRKLYPALHLAFQAVSTGCIKYARMFNGTAFKAMKRQLHRIMTLRLLQHLMRIIRI